MHILKFFLLAGIFCFFSAGAFAEDGSIAKKLQILRAVKNARENNPRNAEIDYSEDAVTIKGREALVHLPPALPPSGERSMVVVLHGGMGNAGQVRTSYHLDETADKYGFIVVYLNGTSASSKLPDKFHAWNAGGGCCGYPSKSGVDDVGYVVSAIKMLSQEYGVDPRKIYGTGHSNGAILTQRIMCETGIYAAAVPIAGPLMIDVKSCPAAQGKRILSIHGKDDVNVPIEGGEGKGISGVTFKPESYGASIFRESGASYLLDVVGGADHNLQNIQTAILKTEGQSFQEKLAHFFGFGEK